MSLALLGRRQRTLSLRFLRTVWWGDPQRTEKPKLGPVFWSFVPPPGGLHLKDLALGEELEAKEESSILPGPEIPGKLNLMVP